MTDNSFPAAAGSTTSRAAVTRHISMQAMRRRTRWPWIALVILLTGGLAGMWTFVAQRQLEQAIVTEATTHLDHAGKAFSIAIARRQAELQSVCRVLVEDPRLKTTLATEGIDEATIADILDDLAKLRGAGFLMVLSPEGRVFAQSGAAELRGLDLSDSNVVKKARTASAAVVGSWVLGGRVMDLSIMAIRYGQDIMGFLVVGQSIDAQILQAVSEQTGVHAANALAGNVVVTSSNETHIKAVLARIAADGGEFKGRVSAHEGATYVTGVTSLGEHAQSHRLVLARSVATSQTSFAPLEWLIYFPPLLVIIAVLFSMSIFRRTP